MTAAAYQLNTPLLAKALHAAAAYPEHFNMEAWLSLAPRDADRLTPTSSTAVIRLDYHTPPTAAAACGTTACLAGWVVHESDTHQLVAVRSDDSDHSTFEVALTPAARQAIERAQHPADLTGADGIAPVAERLLGLTPAEATILFYMPDDLPGVIAYARRLVAKRDPDRLHLLPTPAAWAAAWATTQTQTQTQRTPNHVLTV